MDPRETKIYIALLIGIIVFLVLVAFFVVTIIRYQRKKVSFHTQKIKAEYDFLDKERKRIAADLHDRVGGSISAVKIHLQCLTSLEGRNSEIVSNSEKQIDDIMNDVRRISFNMMPVILKQKGLDEAFREMIDRFTADIGIHVDYRYGIESFPDDKTIHLYLVAQEIMNNVIKHSRATHVLFSVSQIKKKTVLHIKDNGIGFNKNMTPYSGKGLGLYNISSRAELLHATIYLTTKPNKGADYFIEIPV